MHRVLYFMVFWVFFLNGMDRHAQLVGLHQIYEENDLELYSPLRGAAAVESGFLKNWLLYGDASTAVHASTRSLLHVAPGGPLAATQRDPFRRLTAQSIALLAARGSQTTVDLLAKTFTGNKKKEELGQLLTHIQAAQQEEDEEPSLRGISRLTLLGFLYLTGSKAGLKKYRERLFKELQIKPMASDGKIASLYEDSLLGALRARSISDRYPAAIEWGSQELGARCTEFTMQALLYELVYDPAMRQLDITHLPERVQRGLPPELVAFYMEHADASSFVSINDPVAKKAWVALCSKLDGIEWCEVHNDILPTLDNFVHALGGLVGVELAGRSAQERLAAWCQLMRGEKNAIELVAIKESGSETVIHFHITREQDDHYEVSIHLLPEHAWFVREGPSINYDDIGLMRAGMLEPNTAMRAMQQIEAGKKAELDLDLARLHAPYCRLDNWLPHQQEQLLLSFPMLTDQDKYDFMRKVSSRLRKSLLLQTVALNIMRSIGNLYYLPSMLVRALRCGMGNNEALKQLVLEKVPLLEPYNQQEVALALALHGCADDPEYHALIARIAKAIPECDEPDAQVLKRFGLRWNNKQWFMAQLGRGNVSFD